jgi:hypothetical protein
MAKRPKAAAVAEVRNEVLAPPIGETPIYTLILGDDDVEKLAHGRITQALMEQAWSMLSWKREYGQAWAHFECRCPECQLARGEA